MIKHYIILGSSYYLGTRIALHYAFEGEMDTARIQGDLDYIRNTCGDGLPISVHVIQTKGKTFKSVSDYDKYFEDVKVIETRKEFADILLKDRQIKGIDAARYILTKIPCTHLKLEKLVYLCYADYLCDTKENLFDDKIYAFKYGPVIESVYETFKKSGYDDLKAEDDSILYDESKKDMAFRSRIYCAKNGILKLSSIDKTLDKYGSMSADELVKLTHKPSSPWCYAGSGDVSYRRIDDKLILKYHKNEIYK